MLANNNSKIRILIAIAFVLVFFSCLQSATACGTCDPSCSCTDCSGCPDCGCGECGVTESTEKENSKSISEIFNGSTLSLGDGINTNFTKVNIDKDVTIRGNGVNNSILFIDSNNVAFHVESGNTLKLYNLTIVSNYIYSDNEIADFNSLVNLFNGSISGLGTVVFENCKFINNRKTDVVVTVSASSTYSTSRPTFTATVTDFDGNYVDGDVVFYINNIHDYSGRVPIVNGLATYSLDLPNDYYTVHATYVANNNGISQNQLSFNVASFIQPLSVPLPTTGTIYYVNNATGDDNNNGLTIATAKKSILNAYNNAAANSTIVLLPGDFTGTNQVGISLSNKVNMTIMGWNDSSVFIRPSSTFLTVEAGSSSAAQRTINLYNMIIVGNSGNKITILANNHVNIDSVQFVNLTTISSSIYTAATYVNITLNNTQFINIRGSSGGAISTTTAANYNYIRIYNTNFTDLVLSSSGSALNIQGNNGLLFINGSNFLNSTGGSIGAIIRCYYGISVLINHTNFTNCYSTSTSTSSGSSHGGIFCIHNFNGGGSPSLTVDNSRFTNAYSRSEGGVTFTHNGPTTMSNTIFENCTAGANGGVIYNAGSSPITLTNCTFDSNSAGTNGGAIYAASSGGIFIYNSTFKNNSANGTATTNGGGAIYAANGTTNMTNTSFENNNARVYGGAIAAAIAAATINANNSNFRGNYVFGSATVYGGALGSPGGTINIYNSLFSNNSARNNTATSTAYGGAAAVNGASATITLVNCTVIDNWARYGGAFGTGSSGGRINVINNTAIFNNWAYEYGGVAGLGSAGTIVIENSHLYNNSAGSFGGAFGVNGAGTINATNSNVTGNVAGTYGGAVGVNGAGTVNLNFVEMIDNMAVNYGGAVALSGTGGTVNVRSSILKG
ncbi:MAG: hypothetical protein FWH29_08265, partial [Methanobrevibacter sp.]|nr:hypothetical protein [Methanobrevibacter sp.]